MNKDDLLFSFLEDESDKVEADEVLCPTKKLKSREEIIVLDDSMEVPIVRPLGKSIQNKVGIFLFSMSLNVFTYTKITFFTF